MANNIIEEEPSRKLSIDSRLYKSAKKSSLRVRK
jgi:hypothetical protein